ncbi:DEAD/DEAH box helicase family protein [Candidatus Berkiella aquae]|uniref:DEAD/DEAH box helicase family protein n=1 Tax=Candidatus Berkiella aquae TaxID=295108 RepID=A0A0Q9YXN7_9GAMM|nr:DEAD/DEAH box helicase family protein [Candidatus Berkiella aquae]MCS5712121.1 DEAD/DEAH box helicase family protein [Candidatus Berkiella aquae]
MLGLSTSHDVIDEIFNCLQPNRFQTTQELNHFIERLKHSIVRDNKIVDSVLKSDLLHKILGNPYILRNEKNAVDPHQVSFALWKIVFPLLNNEMIHEVLKKTNTKGITLIHLAWMNDFEDIYQALWNVVKNNSELHLWNLTQITSDRRTLLGCMLEKHNFEIFIEQFIFLKNFGNEALFRKILTNLTISGFSLLDMAIKKESIQVTEMLLMELRNDRDIFKKMLSNYTNGSFLPLNSAIRTKNISILKVLLTALEQDEESLALNLNNTAKNGYTILLQALEANDHNISKLIIESLMRNAKALDLNLKSCALDMFTPLNSAFSSENIENVKLVSDILVKNKSALDYNLTFRNSAGFCFLDIAISTEDINLVFSAIKLLMQNTTAFKANLLNMTRSHYTIIDHVVSCRNKNILRLILAAINHVFKDDAVEELRDLMIIKKIYLKEYYYDEVKQLIDEALRGNFPLLSEFELYVELTPVAGINPKYLAFDGHSDTPELDVNHVKNKACRHELGTLTTARQMFSQFVLPIQTPCLEAEFYTNHTALTPDDMVTFVCAGRKEKALLPKPQDGRCVMVCTTDEFEGLAQSQLDLSHIDVLVLNKIVTAFGESSSLNLITNRRLGIFLAAQYWKLNHFMMMDDNIKRVEFNSSNALDENSWDNIYQTLKDLLYAEPCISMTRHFSLPPKEGQLGSKLFMINMRKVNQLFKTQADLTLLFPQPKQAHFWGEDYYFQLVLHYALKGKNQGYRIISKDIATLIRAGKHKHAFALGRGERRYAQPFDVPIMDSLGQEQSQWLKEAIACLNKIIDKNKINYLKHQNKRIEQASTSGSITELSIPVEYKPHFVSELKESIQGVNNRHLRFYQRRALLSIIEPNIPSHACIWMATGSGKSRVQSALACLGYLHLKQGENIVIVTKNITLVSQLYQELYNSRLPYSDELEAKKIPDDAIIPVSCNHTKVEEIINASSYQDSRKIIIFCINSFENLIKADPHFLGSIKLLMLDEYHSYRKQVLSLDKQFISYQDKLLLGFTATPPNKNPLEVIYRYSLKQAINQSIIASVVPVCIDGMDVMSSDFTRFIDTFYHPGYDGKTTLASMKGIIFLKDTTQCNQLNTILNGSGIPSFAIHSDNPQYKEELEQFKREDYGVIVVCKMCTLGFNSADIGYVIVGTSPDRIMLEQMMGRAVRRNNDKIGLIISLDKIVYNQIIELLQGANLQLPISPDYLCQDQVENTLPILTKLMWSKSLSKVHHRPAPTVERVYQLLQSLSPESEADEKRSERKARRDHDISLDEIAVANEAQALKGVKGEMLFWSALPYINAYAKSKQSANDSKRTRGILMAQMKECSFKKAPIKCD